LPHFHFKILLYFVHDDEAKRANYHVNKRIINWPPFWNKVYSLVPIYILLEGLVNLTVKYKIMSRHQQHQQTKKNKQKTNKTKKQTKKQKKQAKTPFEQEIVII